MPRELSWIPTLMVLLAVLSSPAAAQTVIVPDDYPTIQAAVDAGAAVVQVRDGVEPERLTVQSTVTIEPAIRSGYFSNWAYSPAVQSLELDPCGNSSCSGPFVARGLRFLGKVELRTFNQEYVFESCQFDSGLTDVGGFVFAGRKVSVRNCTILGDATVKGAAQFVGNTVIGGTASIYSDGSHDVRNNFVQGPARAGLELSLGDSGGPVSENTIRGTVDGIRVIRDGDYKESNNDIRVCSGDGIVYAEQSSSANINCEFNYVADCGGAGIALRPVHQDYSSFFTISLDGNTVLRTGKEGVYVPTGLARMIRNNTILDAGGDGFQLSSAAEVRGNVVGRSRGSGLHTLGWCGIASGNTFFSNAGSGMDINNMGYTDSVASNISAFNDVSGMRLDHGWIPLLHCNDWFGNVGGATAGLEPGPTDLFLNPLFCDLANADLHLAANSLLLNAGDCGQIGALGQGCGIIGIASPPVSLPNEEFTAWPLPALRKVSFSLVPSREPTVLEVFDVTGARRWQATLPARATHFEWDRRETGGGLASPGVYFARLRRGDVEVARTRIVLTK